MIPVNDRPVTEEPEVEAIVAFDRALAAGVDPTASAELADFLEPVHECQRLLEAVWPRSVLASVELPEQFGRFWILRELGRGGFGVVFLAEDSVLGRQVALKVPRPEVLVTPDVRRRFLREAEAASRLDHPHIVPVYEVGEEGPICYIVSAYCEGLTLAQWLRRQTAAVPIRMASRLVSVLATAVAHAHERGILHRDLKPGNILLQRSESFPSSGDHACHDLGFLPRICDFGLAKLLDQVSQETRTGVPIGSPEYMAPEQAAGRLREHGPSTDVYALGVILYGALTGRPPHRGETDLETLRLVADQDSRSPRALRPGLPRDLETIALKCLEKRPARRYSSASELSADLERFLESRPVHARPVPAWAHGAKWARRRPVHAALAVVLAVLTLAILAGLEWSRTREKQHTRDLRTERAKADRQSLLARQHLAANHLKLAGSLADRGEYEAAVSILDTVARPDGARHSQGFAWNYLDRVVGPRGKSLAALPSLARAIACRADGRVIALTDAANDAFLLDTDTGTVRKLTGKHKLLDCQRLVFSPDGRYLASLAHGFARKEWAKSEINVWDVASGAPLEGMTEDLGLCYQILFSPDGGTLVTVEAVFNRAAPVRAWRLSGEKRRITLAESLRGDQLAARLSPAARGADRPGQPFRLSDVLAVTPGDAGTMAILLETGEIALYHSGSGYCKAVCRTVGPEVVFVARSDDDTPCPPAEIENIGRAACALLTGKHFRALSPGVAIMTARFSSDGRAVAVFERYRGRPRAALRLIDVGTGRAGVEFMWGDVPEHSQFAFTPRGDALIVTGSGAARVWGFHGWRAPAMLSGHNKEVWGLVFSRDGRTLVSSSDDGTLKLWDMDHGLEKRTLKGHGSLVSAVAYSPDGELLASAGWDKTIRLWHAASGDPVATLSGHSDRVRSVAFSPDGKTLASGGNDRVIRLWEIASRRELKPPLTGHTEWVFSVAFAPDGRTLYSGALDKTIRLWDWAEGNLRAVWHAQGEVYALAFSPDGQTLAAAQDHGIVRLWDVDHGTARPPLRGHHSVDVLGVGFSPDGRTLASAGRDQTVRLWDPLNGYELLTLHGHEGPAHAIAFSPDGTILATGSHDGAIKLWRASREPTAPETIGSGSTLPGFTDQKSVSKR